MFEFDGDKNHIRHVLYCCSASRPATEGETTEESKSVKTEKLSLKASALPNGLVKSKTCESTDQTTYDICVYADCCNQQQHRHTFRWHNQKRQRD